MTNSMVFLTVIAVVISFSESSRILISAPFGTKSHKNMYVPLVRELVDRGHQITVITNYVTPEFLSLDNVTEIVLDNLVFDMSQYPNAFDKLLSSESNWAMTLLLLRGLFELPHKITEVMYKDSRVKQTIANNCFDLVIVSQVLSMASAPLAWHFKAPMIVFCPNKLFPGTATILGDDEHTNYVPFVFTSYTDKMNLWQRTINTVVTKAFQLVSQLNEEYSVLPVVQNLGISDCPPLQDLIKNMSLVFTNSHPSFTYPRTLPPQVIEIGGIHCRPAKSLPKNLEDFVSVTGTDGFILFAIGSLQQMEDMPEHLIQSFIRTFARLPQRVIWQWKGKIRPDLPANVLAIPWLPQQDLLGHNGCRAFITHGGLNSLQEAIFHGVPVLGLPFGIDHNLNLVRAVNEGYALILEWKEVSEGTLSNAVKQLLYNPSFSMAATKLSFLLRDQLQSPLERAVFWTEYVMRHNGTEHLRLESRNLSFYQRALIDVYLILFLTFTIPLVLIVLCFKCFCHFKSSKLSINSVKKKQ